MNEDAYTAECPAWVKELSGDFRIHDLGAENERRAVRVVELENAVEEALRCLTLIGHVPRSENTWASRCQAATEVLAPLLGDGP